jgi:hypothetical protein
MSIFKQSFVDKLKANILWKKIHRVYSDDIINIHIQSRWSHFAHYNESEIREWLAVCSSTDLIEYNVATHNAMQSMSDTISKQQDWMKKIRNIRFRSPVYRTKE